MTRDEAIKNRDAITHFFDGGDVQWNCRGSWIDTDDPSFRKDLEWRKKPHPLECWAVEFGPGNVSFFGVKCDAERSGTLFGSRVIHLVEKE